MRYTSEVGCANAGGKNNERGREGELKIGKREKGFLEPPNGICYAIEVIGRREVGRGGIGQRVKRRKKKKTTFSFF